MSEKATVPGFGLFVIGNEILDGRVRDKHFESARSVLQERHTALRYALFLPDEAETVESQLRWAESRPEPYFCCGGIGSTPDDLTRGCAARVAGVPLALHPEGVSILKNRFGKEATPARLRMVEFPRGATLIPNPVNQVPGFSIGRGYFLPGFPDMASAMMAWVLDTRYLPGDVERTAALVLPGSREADLVTLMEAFTREHPEVSFSSLPRFTDGGTEVVLGLRGLPDAVDKAAGDLAGRLDRAGISYRKQASGDGTATP